MKIIRILVLAFLIFFQISCNSDYNPEITVSELTLHMNYLAGDELEGRYPGTKQDSALIEYLSSEFQSYGLKFFTPSGIQSFDFISSVKLGESNQFIINDIDTANQSEFTPFSFSSNAELSAHVVFAGFGFDFKNDTIAHNDYKNIDVKGKWVLVFRGNPTPGDQKNAFSQYQRDRDKAMVAKDKGASGVMMVSGESFDSFDVMNAMAEKSAELGIPCIQINRVLANKILAFGNVGLKHLEEKIAGSTDNNSFMTNVVVSAKTDVVSERTSTGNVIAYLEGSNPELSGEYIVIGAHHDHLGMGGKGSSSRKPDTIAIHYGADDNASGVSAILEMAEKFSRLKPERSVIFATFGAEEKGLIGSKYFVENPPVPIENIKLMLNIDMIGRLRDSSLQIGGIGTSPDFKEILLENEKNTFFRLSLSEPGYGPSDHASFYSKDKPVLFFSTGGHSDYHTPDDIIDSINIEGLKDITKFISELALHFSNADSTLIFQEAGPKEATASRHRGKITLGIMPDVSSEGTDGLKILAVTEGKPAANSGMKKGDTIIAIEGKPVGNIQDYMFRIGQLNPGDKTIVKIKRGNETIEVLVQL